MDYWNTLITEKSWNLLKELNKKIDFILIGGWAAYLWSKAHKSKDIDIVVDFKELEKIKLKYNLKKNENLKKYEIIIDEIDVDIYVPYYSNLAVPIGEIQKNSVKIENFNVVKPEILLILKQGAEIDRADSEKGLKDRIDILDILLNYNIDFNQYKEKLREYKLTHYKNRLINIMNTFKELKYINLNPRARENQRFSVSQKSSISVKFKLKKIGILNKLKI